jgi:hypothetical protein
MLSHGPPSSERRNGNTGLLRLAGEPLSKELGFRDGPRLRKAGEHVCGYEKEPTVLWTVGSVRHISWRTG